jgi:hypothetical protein
LFLERICLNHGCGTTAADAVVNSLLTCLLLLLLPGHNLLQVPLVSLLSEGISWALESPGDRAAFTTTCLAPLLAKLSPEQAEKARHSPACTAHCTFIKYIKQTKKTKEKQGRMLPWLFGLSAVVAP